MKVAGREIPQAQVDAALAIIRESGSITTAALASDIRLLFEEQSYHVATAIIRKARKAGLIKWDGNRYNWIGPR